MKRVAAGAELKVSLIYAAFATLWILLSDRVVEALFPESFHGTVQTMKGGFFVVATASLLYWLMRQELQRQRQLQLDLTASAEELAGIIETLPEAYFRLDHQGRMAALSGQIGRMLGHSPDRFIGRMPGELLASPEQEEAILRAIAGARGNPVKLETRLLRKDGRAVWGQIHALAIYAPDGTLHGMHGTIGEVEESKKTEAELMASREAIEEARSELLRLASVLTRDLSDPLRTVAGHLGQLDKLHGGQLGEEGGRLVEAARGGCRSMEVMLAGIFDYARIDRDGKPLRPMDPANAVRKAERHLKLTIEGSEARIETGELPHIKGDEAQIARLFQNLIDNAIKHRRPDHAPHVLIEAGPADQPGFIRFSVQDNGMGVAPSEFTHLFRPFDKPAPNGDKRNEDGQEMGIGLAICRRIVERHGGRIWLENPPGPGSLFKFDLPAA